MVSTIRIRARAQPARAVVGGESPALASRIMSATPRPWARRVLKWTGYLAASPSRSWPRYVLVFALQGPRAPARLAGLAPSPARPGISCLEPRRTDVVQPIPRARRSPHQPAAGAVLDDAKSADDLAARPLHNPNSVVSRLALDTPYNHSYELAPPGEPRVRRCSCMAFRLALQHAIAGRDVSRAGLLRRRSTAMPGHGTAAIGPARCDLARTGTEPSCSQRNTPRRVAAQAGRSSPAVTPRVPR
jgi:hypothetical protein